MRPDQITNPDQTANVGEMPGDVAPTGKIEDGLGTGSAPNAEGGALREEAVQKVPGTTRTKDDPHPAGPGEGPDL